MLKVHPDNYGKEHRKRKEDFAKEILQMRADLPVYTLNEIRLLRMSYHEAIITTLKDEGYPCSADFIGQLVEFSQNLKDAGGPNSISWARPLLATSRSELEVLRNSLVKAETYHNQEMYKEECEEFLQLAIYFAFGTSTWWWLGEQLLIQSISVCVEYSFLGGYFEALSRLCYGKFLTENIEEYESAKSQLLRAREMSCKYEWTIRNLFPGSKRHMYMEANYYLHICYMVEAKYYMKTNYTLAGNAAVMAKARAAEACYPEGEAEALLMKGICALARNEASSAIHTLEKVIKKQFQLENHEGVCDARLELAKAYLKDGKTKEAIKLLIIVKEKAEELDLPYYLGQACYHLGEYFLNKSQCEKASALLEESSKILTKINRVRESEKVHILAGLSSGMNLLPKYLNLIINSGKPGIGGYYLNQLFDWKDSRVKFWKESSAELPKASRTVEDILADEVKNISAKKGSIK